jgi:hypothetical protein
MVVAHAVRTGLIAWLRNMFLYGRGRCFHLKRHPEEWHPKFAVPAFVVVVYLAGAALVALGYADISFLLGLATVHLAGIALALAGEARRQRRSPMDWLTATWIGYLTHLAYGAGALSELPRQQQRFDG